MSLASLLVPRGKQQTSGGMSVYIRDVSLKGKPVDSRSWNKTLSPGRPHTPTQKGDSISRGMADCQEL